MSEHRASFEARPPRVWWSPTIGVIEELFEPTQGDCRRVGKRQRKVLYELPAVTGALVPDLSGAPDGRRTARAS